MSTHTIVAELEVVRGDVRVYPKVEITFEYEPFPGAILEFRKAKLIDGDGLNPKFKMLQRWAADWLFSYSGTFYAVNCAKADLTAMRHAN